MQLRRCRPTRLDDWTSHALSESIASKALGFRVALSPKTAHIDFGPRFGHGCRMRGGPKHDSWRLPDFSAFVQTASIL